MVNGGSDAERVGYEFIPDIFPIQWGAVRSYLEVPNHLVAEHTNIMVEIFWNTFLTRIDGS